MAITQDTFSQYSQIGYNAQLNTNFPWWADTLLAENGSIPFGVAVAYGTDDDQGVVVTGDTSAGEIVGVTLRTQSVENNEAGLSEYHEGRAMSILTKGRMYIDIEDGSTAGGDVFIVPDTGEIVSTSTDNVQLPGAKFVATVDGAGISEIEIN